MGKNVGRTDKVLRLIIGTTVIAAGVYFQSWWGAVGVIFIVTALISWCPPYALLGINTCKIK